MAADELSGSLQLSHTSPSASLRVARLLVGMRGEEFCRKTTASLATLVGHFVERQNLTMRMSIRRFIRLTNAFSKKLENHIAAIALYFMYHNFCRVHQTLRVTPAMEAGLSDHIWTLDELMGLISN
jgi:hypothetical protein